MNPDTITSVLGLKPVRQHSTGDERRDPRGKLIGGLYPSTFWQHRFGVEGIKDLAPGLDEILTSLEAQADFIRGISESGGSTELFCGIFVEINWCESLPHPLLGRPAALQIDLGLDAYLEPEKKQLRRKSFRRNDRK